MPRHTLEYSEMAWWLIDNTADPHYNRTMIGNARDIALLRDGLDVLITTTTIGCHDVIIDADTTVKGFGSDKDGKTLLHLTDVGYIYHHSLQRRS